MASLSDDRQRNLLFELESAFRPGAPVDRVDLFTGRTDQMGAVLQAVAAAGQHAVIFGERGVGKTSLAAVCIEIAQGAGRIGLRINCDNSDNFQSLWQKVIDEFAIVLAALEDVPDRHAALSPTVERATEILNSEEVTPNSVRIALRHVAGFSPVVVFIDEFDQIHDIGTLSLVSNTIKVLSDQIEDITIVPVGVSGTVEGLIEGHQSIQRALVQVHMPRMNREEIQGIAERGLQSLGMSADGPTMDFLVDLPRGLPQYAHLLAQEACRVAIRDGRSVITRGDVTRGLTVGLSRVDHSLQRAYDEATYSPRQTRFREVLAACVVAAADRTGFFSPTDVREPYSAIINEDVDISRFNPQLVQLAEGRGRILHREGGDRRWRYRFSDPLMEPYVLLKGIQDGLLAPWFDRERSPRS